MTQTETKLDQFTTDYLAAALWRGSNHKRMRTTDKGSTYGVSVSAREVSEFKAKWPCSGMPNQAIWFEFEKRNGDLVDLIPSNWEERGANGSAMVALSQDAQAFGKKSLNL